MLKLALSFITIASIFSHSMAIIEKELVLKELRFDYKNEGYYKTISDLYAIEDTFFITDFRSNRVSMYKFYNDLAVFIKHIGNIGSGPGDLMGPFNTVASDDLLAINDQGFVSFFGYDGRYINKFRLFINHIGSLLYNNKYYFLSANPKSKKLVNIYDTSGNCINSICDKYLIIKNLNDKETIDPFFEYILYDGDIFVDEKHLIYINKRFGTLRRYTFSGELLDSTEIGDIFGENGKRKIIENKINLLDKNNETSVRNSTIHPYAVYQRAFILGDEIFLLCDQHNRINNAPIFSIEIIGINKDTFKMSSHYKYQLEKDSWIGNFAARLSNNKPVFIIDIKTKKEDGIYEFYVKN